MAYCVQEGTCFINSYIRFSVNCASDRSHCTLVIQKETRRHSVEAPWTKVFVDAENCLDSIYCQKQQPCLQQQQVLVLSTATTVVRVLITTNGKGLTLYTLVFILMLLIFSS